MRQTIPQRNTVRRMELFKKIEECKRARRKFSLAHNDGYHSSLILDAQIAHLMSEIDELYDVRRKSKQVR